MVVIILLLFDFEMKNILHITSQIGWRGGEFQIAFLLDAIKKDSHFQSIVLCPKNSEMNKFCQNNNIESINFNKNFVGRLTTSFSLQKICKKNKISFIHAHDSHALGIVAFANALSINELPIIAQRRVIFKTKNNIFSKYKYNARLVKKIICDSAMIKSVLSTMLYNPDKSCVVYAGINIEKFANRSSDNYFHEILHVEKKTRIVCNVAALTEEKDYFTFLKVAKIITKKYPDVVFAIIGEGQLRPEIEKYIEKNQLKQKVKLVGFRDDVNRLITDAEIMLVTSTQEGLGLNILEAFASKVPVVATRTGGIPEIVIDGKTGLLAEVKDIFNLSNNVSKLLDNQALRSSIIENALSFVSNYSYQKTTHQIIEIYKELIS